MKARKKLAIYASREIGKIMLRGFGRSLRVTSKGDRDLVSNIDKKADRLIVGLIKKRFPQDGIISEESPRAFSQSGFNWIIDPIDGTHNFVRNIDVFGSSVAVEFGGKVVLGVICMPVTDEFYSAERGKGAFCNGKRISVSKRKIKQATLIYDSSIRYNKGKMLAKLGVLAREVFNVRMFGSTVRGLTYVAQGRAEMEIEFYDKLWDFAAGLLLVEEAGGRCTDFKGQPWDTNTKQYVASNGVIHNNLLKIMKGA